MNKDTFERAVGRLDRSWNEARYRYNRRSYNESSLLVKHGDKVLQAVDNLSSATGKLRENPCAACKRCCTQAAFSSGFHTHTEREVLLSQSVTEQDLVTDPLKEYVVNSWGEGKEEPPERCLFLSPVGCNLPTRLKSSQCATYVCLDKLAPQLAIENKEIEYKKARTKHVLALRVIQDGLSDLSFERCVDNLGDG